MYSRICGTVRRRPNPRKRRRSRDQLQQTNFKSVMPNDDTLFLLIDTEHGLLDELIACDVLNRRQVDLIESQKHAESRVKKLLEEVGKASNEQQKRALQALHRTHQSHVVNYIVHCGQRPLDEDDRDDWPFCGSESWVRNLQYCKQLIELIDSRNGLLDEMLAAGCINIRIEDSLSSIINDYDRNRQLVDFFSRLSIADYKKFIECLVKTNQHHVASLLEPNAIENGYPVSEQYKLHVTQNLPAIVEILDSENGLLEEMLSAGCITWRQKEFIRSAELRVESNKRLLKIVMRGSQVNFNTFIECLKKSDQLHLADLLLNPNSVTTSMVAKSNLSAPNEDFIVKQFISLLRTTSPDRREELCSTVNQVTTRLRDVRVVAMQTKSSIKLTFICESTSGLEYLYELYSSSELKTIVQELFFVLLGKRQPVVVDSLTWKMSDYDSCVQYLLPGSVYSQLQQFSDNLLDDLTQSPQHSCSLSVEKLPFELFEMLLIKAAGQLFVAFVKRTLEAELYALTALNTVAKYWYETLASRRWNTSLLKRYFKHVRHPYTRRPRPHASVHYDGYSFVAGVAEFAEKLYVICTRSDTIQVYDVGTNISSMKRHIVIKGLLTPVDLAVCRDSGDLFVSDSFGRCIWRVNASAAAGHSTEIDKFLQVPFSPMKLSVCCNRLLVTSSSAGDALYQYSNDGELTRRIQVPNSKRAYHALETLHGTFIVSHGAEAPTDLLPDHSIISELSADGEVLRAYRGSERLLNYYNFLAIDVHENIFVCDFFNKQVLLLNSKLQLKQVLVSLDECPSKIGFSQRNGLLFVLFGPLKPNNIDVFSILDY